MNIKVNFLLPFTTITSINLFLSQQTLSGFALPFESQLIFEIKKKIVFKVHLIKDWLFWASEYFRGIPG